MERLLGIIADERIIGIFDELYKDPAAEKRIVTVLEISDSTLDDVLKEAYIAGMKDNARLNKNNQPDEALEVIAVERLSSIFEELYKDPAKERCIAYILKICGNTLDEMLKVSYIAGLKDGIQLFNELTA